ncbi:hypothetical protein DFH06DRAFT_448903 [Mycena polygramma]|nr:hypothetical protein DFH06DRAFT_448903 [Mycena polygramma]
MHLNSAERAQFPSPPRACCWPISCKVICDSPSLVSRKVIQPHSPVTCRAGCPSHCDRSIVGVGPPVCGDPGVGAHVRGRGRGAELARLPFRFQSSSCVAPTAPHPPHRPPAARPRRRMSVASRCGWGRRGKCRGRLEERPPPKAHYRCRFPILLHLTGPHSLPPPSTTTRPSSSYLRIVVVPCIHPQRSCCASALSSHRTGLGARRGKQGTSRTSRDWSNNPRDGRWKQSAAVDRDVVLGQPGPCLVCDLAHSRNRRRNVERIRLRVGTGSFRALSFAKPNKHHALVPIMHCICFAPSSLSTCIAYLPGPITSIRIPI